MINLVRGRYCPFRGAPHVGFFWWEQTKCRPIRFPPSSTSREDATDDDLPTGQGGGRSAGSGGYVTTGWFARSSVALLARFHVLYPGLSCAPSSSVTLAIFFYRRRLACRHFPDYCCLRRKAAICKATPFRSD